MQLAATAYRVTEQFPNAEKYRLTAQIRRCAVSVPSNIAEGSGRDTDPEFARFLRIAFGSACDLETQMLLAIELHFGDAAALSEGLSSSERVRRMLEGLIRQTSSR